MRLATSSSMTPEAPTPDGLDARIADHTFNHALLHLAEIAVELLTSVHDFVQRLPSIALDHRYFLHTIGFPGVAPGRMVD